MSNLIQRLTDATVNERGLFEEAYRARFPEPSHTAIPHVRLINAKPSKFTPGAHSDWMLRRAKFDAMLDAEAWTSAAEMLVPEGCLYMARTVWDDANAPTERAVGYASIDRYFRDDGGLMWKENSLALGATPALALLIAALKAHGGNDAE